MNDDVDKSSNAFGQFYSRRGLTRRGFISSAIAVPVAASANCASTQREIYTEETALDFVETENLISVSIRRNVDPERRDFWQKLRVLNHVQPAEANEPSVWQISKARFGPDAVFRLRTSRSGGLLRYTLTVEKFKYGRVDDRRLAFVFQQHDMVDEDGNALLAEIKACRQAYPSDYDSRTQELIDTQPDTAPGRKAFTVEVSTNLWSLSHNSTLTQTFALEPLPLPDTTETPDTSHLINGQLRFHAWVNKKGAPLYLWINAGRVTSTMRLIFNGQIGFNRNQSQRAVRLFFDNTISWRVDAEHVTLWAMTQDLRMADLTMGYQPIDSAEAAPDPETDAAAPQEIEIVELAVLPDSLDTANATFELSGTAKVHSDSLQSPTLQDPKILSFHGNDTDPGLDLILAPADALTVQLRILEANDVTDGSLATGMMRSEVSLLAKWSSCSLTGDPDTAAGPFEKLNGRLMERVEAPDTIDRFDYARCVGNISFSANFTGAASRHWRVKTPVGPIGFRGLADDEDTPHETDSAFAPRRGDQIQVVYHWDGWRRNDPVQRNTPRAEWAEINGVLREAALQLPDATATRLSFAPTHLTFLFAPEDLAPPLTSYIRLGTDRNASEDSPQERAQLDLGQATLQAARSADLLSLSFRFRDFGLSFIGADTELVRKNAMCLAVPPSEDKGRPHDTRPVLVVDFPGQHLLEEAYFAPLPPDPPDVEITVFENGAKAAFVKMTLARQGTLSAVTGHEDRIYLQSLPEEGGWCFDPNDRVQVTELLRRVTNTDIRVKIRNAIKDQKILAEGANGAFNKQVEAYSAEIRARRLDNLPTDQCVYIGPFALDPDALRLAALVWSKERETSLEDLVDAMFRQIETQSKALIAAATEATENQTATPNDQRVANAKVTFDGALALEQRLEALFPSYQLYRTAYREAMIDVFEDGESGFGDVQLEAEHLEAVYDLRGFAKILPEWAMVLGVSLEQFNSRHAAAYATYLKVIKGADAVDSPARARLAEPSRLAFRVRCRDGIAAARADVENLDTPANVRSSLVRPQLPLTLASLTRFSDFELAVTARSEAVYRASETGRLDAASARRLDTSQGARLDHLGFTDGDFVTSETRLGEVAQSLRQGPSDYETALNMARLTLSPDQNAAVVTNNRPVPAGIFDLADETGLAPPITRLFSTRFLVDEVNPNMRAVSSPDLRADVFENRAMRRVNGQTFPGKGPPPRGPLAPWHIGPHQSQTQTFGEADAGASSNTIFSRLLTYLRASAERRRSVAPRDLRFRAPLDAYARHEIVILSSAWGLPALGKRNASGALIDGSNQAEAEARHRLIDVMAGSALYVPATLGVSYCSLGMLGMSLRHSTSFSTPAAAFAGAFDGQITQPTALYPALSVESWQQWTNLGRDVQCEVVYKGFLWPIGQRASLVQVTERAFFINTCGEIRAVLRQRMFIRVGKAEKLYPALKQPAQGRRFPVERLINLTSQTPDIVDPSDTQIPDSLPVGDVLPNGRVNLGDGFQGLVFWPRTAKIKAANIRFELDLDGTKTDLPLVFVDNVAANHAKTLEALALVYNEIATPDPLDHAKKQRAYAPLDHLRTMDMGGGKRRYAPEREAGSASVETSLWTLCATGLSQGLATPAPASGRAGKISRQDVLYRSDPLLQGADQPPFYPALDCARIRPRQAERLIGGVLRDAEMTALDDRFLRAVPDGHYVAYGLPDGTAETAEGASQVAKDNEAEIYLAMIDQSALDMGSKGDNSGGVFRPSGRLVALSRARGAMTWNSPQHVTLPAAPALVPAQNDKSKELRQSCNTLITMAPLMSLGEVAEKPGTPAPSDTDTDFCSPAEILAISTDFEQGLKKAQKIYSDLFDGNAKILGLISIKDLFRFIKALDPPSSGAPKLAEQVQYGAAQAKGALDDVSGALDSAVETAQTEVILPLSGAVDEIREGWEDLDRQIEEQTDNIPGGIDISFESVFPELHCTLVAFDTALKKAAATDDIFAFALTVSEVFSSGRRFLDALFRASSDPGQRIAAAVSAGIDDIVSLFRDLEQQRTEILLTLLESAFGAAVDPESGAPSFVDILEIADWITDDDATGDVPDLLGRYANDLVNWIIPANDTFDLLVIPGDIVKPDALRFSSDDLRTLGKSLLIRLLRKKGKFDLDDLFLDLPDLLPGAAPQNALENDGDPPAIEFARMGLQKIETVLASLNSEPLEAARDFLVEVLDLWDDRESIGAAIEQEVKEQLTLWFTGSFNDELRLIRTSELHIRTLIAAAQTGDVPRAIAALLDLIELHFGPLDLGPLQAQCDAFLSQVVGVVNAVLPATDSSKNLATKIGNTADSLNDLKDDAEQALAELEKDETQDALDDLPDDLRDRVTTLVVDIKTAGGPAKALIDKLGTTLTEVQTALIRDIELLQQLHTALNDPPLDECGSDPINLFKGLHRKLRGFVDHRRLALLRLGQQLEKIAKETEDLTKTLIDGQVGLLIGIGGVVVLLEDFIDRDAFDDLSNAAKQRVTALKAKAEEIQKSLEARANTYAQTVAIYGHQALTFLKTQITSLTDGLEAALKDLAPGTIATIKTALNDEVAKLDALIAWFTLISTSNDAVKDLTNPPPTELPNLPDVSSTLDIFKSELEVAVFKQVAKVERTVMDEFARIEDIAATYFRQANEKLIELANEKIQLILGEDIPFLKNDFPGLYADLLGARNSVYDDITSTGLTLLGEPLLIAPLNRATVGTYVPSADAGTLNTANDQLAGDVAWLEHLKSNDLIGSDVAEAFAKAFLDEWSDLQPTPLVIATQIIDIVSDIIRGDIFSAIDFQFLREQVEDYILNLVPVKTEMNFGYGVELGSEVKAATAGIFAPADGCKLRIDAEITIDLSGVTDGKAPAFSASTKGSLGAFDVKLIGDAFDALTLKFNGATFQSADGKKFEFDIEYSDYEIGPMLEFVQEFQKFLTPKGDSGFYLEPITSPSFGIEAGYVLNLGDFSVGAMAISNVGLAASAILPFDNGDARFRASLSRRLSPFTITYLPFGGSGFFGIEANANGIIGFEASFEFGGSAVFAFGPLSGKGRLMSGFYIRMSVADNGQKLTELSATVFVGGSASIWIFNFSAALSVRLGMVNGNMSGEAIFSFSFSFGLGDYSYSITMYKEEAKGFNGQDSASLYNSPFPGLGTRFAELGNFGRVPLAPLDDSQPRIDRTTVCQSRHWGEFSSYFNDDNTTEDPFA